MTFQEALERHYFQFRYLYHGNYERQRQNGRYICGDSTLMHILKGRGEIIIDSNTVEVQPYSVVYIPPFTEFTERFYNGRVEHINLHYCITTKEKQSYEDYFRLPQHFSIKNDSFALKKIEYILSQYKPLTDKGIMLSVSVHELVLHYLFSQELNPAFDLQHDPFIQSLHNKLKDPNYKIYDAVKLSKEFFLSISQIDRRFKAAFGVTPKQFWDGYRFYWVRTSLIRLESSRNLSHLAQESGFKDEGYFCRWFRKKAGMPPLQYKREVIDKMNSY